MPIEELAVAILTLVDDFIKLKGISAKRKYLDAWMDNQNAIREEIAKWPDSDDTVLEQLYDKKKDIAQAAQAELQLAASQK